MKFSIIVPALNEDKYIENCLKSIFAQTFKDFELIVVIDKKSKDRTYEIARKYTENVLISNSSGIANVRNYGAKFSKGENIVFVDADVILMPNLLETFYKVMKKRNVVGCGCPIIPSKYDSKYFLIFIFFNSFVEFSVKAKKPKIVGSVCCYKREYFEKVNGFRNDLKVLEDFDLSERISKFGKIVFTKETFAITSIRRIEKWGLFNSAKNYLKYYLKYITFRDFLRGEKYEPIR